MAGETPSREGSVSRFLDIFARGSAAAAFAALIAGKSLWVVGGFVFGALVLHLLGTRWPAIQTRLGPRLAAVVERVTSNRRYRIAAIVVVVGCFAVTGLMYVVKLRSDLDEIGRPHV